MAEQEEAEGADRSVVTKLYETALEKFGGEASLSHAWTLLRAAEYIEFSTYAKEALAVLERTETSQDLEDAQMALIRGRARVLLTSDAYPSAVAGTLASLSSRAERGTLVGKLRLCVMNIALSAVDACVQWEGDSKSPVDSADDLRLLSSKVAVKWALAAADGMVSGEQIEARLKPAATYLDAHPSQTDCCKLRAQMLIVLSSVLSDEDEAINAFDAAVEALKRAHKIDPKDEDVASQLEDLGVGI
ncbi:hypothetical protein GGI12_000318 [Dipsacomyces acuminosporus]|nr:hypothetical protein GGI12_000318 [Dipsacomyces acuminosporus]